MLIEFVGKFGKHVSKDDPSNRDNRPYRELKVSAIRFYDHDPEDLYDGAEQLKDVDEVAYALQVTDAGSLFIRRVPQQPKTLAERKKMLERKFEERKKAELAKLEEEFKKTQEADKRALEQAEEIEKTNADRLKREREAERAAGRPVPA